MNYLNIVKWEASDTIQLLLTISLTLITYLVIYSLKPKLKINISKLDAQSKLLEVDVINEGRYSAVNLKIEVCIVSVDGKHTYHFSLDHSDYLILPAKDESKKVKRFKVVGISESALRHTTFEDMFSNIESGKFKLRTRIHSCHEFSGLGKAVENIHAI